MEHVTLPTWSEIIDRYYQMNPETDVIIFNGLYLTEGMVVIPEAVEHRGDPKRDTSAPAKERCMKWNRWMRVDHLVTDGDSTQFIATYHDGTQKKIHADPDMAWIAKKVTVPDKYWAGPKHKGNNQ